MVLKNPRVNHGCFCFPERMGWHQAPDGHLAVSVAEGMNSMIYSSDCRASLNVENTSSKAEAVSEGFAKSPSQTVQHNCGCLGNSSNWQKGLTCRYWECNGSEWKLQAVYEAGKSKMETASGSSGSENSFPHFLSMERTTGATLTKVKPTCYF